MFKHFMIAFNLAALTGLANAAAPGVDYQPSRIDLKDCIASTHADADLYTVELVGGTRVDITRSADGKPAEIRITHPDGEESVVTSYEALAAKDAPPAGVEKGAKEQQRGQVRRVLGAHFRNVLRAHCKQIHKAESGEAVALKPGDPDAAAEWLLFPELIESRAYWFSEARWQVEDTFYAGMDDWSNQIVDWVEELKDKQRDLPACSAVRQDCRTACDRVGAYAGGVVCGGLAAVASALSAGIGVSVGVYCGGRVILKIEECRFNCVVPGVPCN